MQSLSTDVQQDPLYTTLRHAFVDAGATLQNIATDLHLTRDDTLWQQLSPKVQYWSTLTQATMLPAFDDAVQSAWERLCIEYTDPSIVERILPLLTINTPSLALFRQVILEELVLSHHPNTGRMLDHYRRDVRWNISVHGTAALQWAEVEPVLRRFFQTLFPQAVAQHADLHALLPDADQRALLDTVRSQAAEVRAASLKRIELLLAELTSQRHIDQRIVASEGGSIAQVHQTIVVGERIPLPISHAELASLYYRYQGFIIETFGLLDFRGILQFQNVVRLWLEEVYVPLFGRRTLPTKSHTIPYAAAHHTHHSNGLRSFRRPDHAETHHATPLHQFVRDYPFLVVLGAPGAGKSTLVRSILLALAEGQGYQKFGLEGIWLPIFFPVSAFAEARSTPGGSDLAPLDYLSTYYAGLSQPDYIPLFQRALCTGRALVLFDGLDEVRSERLRLVRCLEAFVREWDAPGNRFIATSRIAGYDDAPLDDNLFVRVTVEPLTDEAIRCFITQWSTAFEMAGSHDLPTDPTIAEIELQRRMEDRSHDLSNAVFTNPNVTELARSPLLLTILALIHHQGASLPDRRVDLYRLCVEALAETWNRARSLTGREIDVYLGSEKLDERFVVNLLGPAALWMQEHQPGGLVERGDLEQQLVRTLIQTDGLPPGRAQRLAQNFVELVRRETGLLQERGYQRYGFMHLTFEEYLAARALLESVTVENPDALIHTRCVDAGWREVLRLMVASASQREAQRLLLHLLHAPTTAETYGRPMVLAGECLLDIGRNSATQRAWSAVIEHLVSLLASTEPTLAVRVGAGQVLGKLGDPRLLNTHNGDAEAGSYWCSIAAGVFWCSTDRADQPLYQVELPYNYLIARFPVTHAEYQRFTQVGGYQERCWWTATGWDFLQPGRHPTLLDDQTQTIRYPGNWEHPSFNNPSQPVVGVSWYEAMAYCAWLTDQGHKAGWLPMADIIRLPTSLEWERAARHSDQRHYPWGNAEPDMDRANYEDTGLHAPAPVGCFPAGAAASGVLDLAGNVWEWTATQAHQRDQGTPLADCQPTEKPVIRGGAFNWSSDYLHCGAQYWFSPGHRQNLLGFRVVWAPETI